MSGGELFYPPQASRPLGLAGSNRQSGLTVAKDRHQVRHAHHFQHVLHLIDRVQQNQAAAPALHSLGAQKQCPDANRCQERDAGEIDHDTLVGTGNGCGNRQRR